MPFESIKSIESIILSLEKRRKSPEIVRYEDSRGNKIIRIWAALFAVDLHEIAFAKSIVKQNFTSIRRKDSFIAFQRVVERWDSWQLIASLSYILKSINSLSAIIRNAEKLSDFHALLLLPPPPSGGKIELEFWNRKMCEYSWISHR